MKLSEAGILATIRNLIPSLPKAGGHFGQLSRDLIAAVTTSGGFEPGGHNADLQPVLCVTAENFSAGASAFSVTTRAGIVSGRLTEETLTFSPRSRPGRRTSA